MNDLMVINELNFNETLREIEDAFYDIPFENSAFQTENFVIGGQVTPERAYRAIGLRMFNRINALKEAQYGRAKEEIDIDELEEKIANPDTNKFDRKRAQLEIEFKLSHRPYTEKLINDAIKELNILYKHFKALPKYTREEFEKGEDLHFQHKLQRQIAGQAGAIESMMNMQTDLKIIERYEEEYSKTKLIGREKDGKRQ